MTWNDKLSVTDALRWEWVASLPVAVITGMKIWLNYLICILYLWTSTSFWYFSDYVTPEITASLLCMWLLSLFFPKQMLRFFREWKKIISSIYPNGLKVESFFCVFAVLLQTAHRHLFIYMLKLFSCIVKCNLVDFEVAIHAWSWRRNWPLLLISYLLMCQHADKSASLWQQIHIKITGYFSESTLKMYL